MNPAHDYRKIAKKIAEQMLHNITQTVMPGKSPDLYWNIEAAIMDALKYVDKRATARTEARMRAEFKNIMDEFNDDGPVQN